MLDESLKAQILDILSQNLDIENFTVFLFGSFARGDEKRYSDIDIGILGKEPVDGVKVSRMRQELEEKAKTLRGIDFVDFSSVNDEVFKKDAIKYFGNMSIVF